jgi:hypothetical protein
LHQWKARHEIAVQTAGEVLEGARDHACKQIAALVGRLPERLLHPGVKLTVFGRPGLRLPALAQATLVVDGRPVRAQVAAAFALEAVRLLRTRLGEQAARLTGPGTPRPWPVDDRTRPVPLPRPAGRRDVVRHKAFALRTCTPDQGVLTMDLMDYDFHLFVDADTGQDSVVYRTGPTGYRLARLEGMAPPSTPMSVPLTVNVHPVPRLDTRGARDLLDATELPFRFFRDDTTGRGSVLYRRCDGHYGLLAPAARDE